MDSANAFAQRILTDLTKILQGALPGARLVDARALRPDDLDDSGSEATTKASGYGIPLKLDIEDEQGRRRSLVFHTATANPFGHDRRADRAAEMILGYDTFNGVPRHVRALDVGAIRLSGDGLVSVRDTGEFYLLTEYAEGHVYAEELRALGHGGRLSENDLVHCEALAKYLIELHAERRDEPLLYRRAARDLVGSGEGIAGIIDGYPSDVDRAPSRRLQRIEKRCADYRWKLRAFEHRLTRAHGDFHPFNVLFDDRGELFLLDTSRGSVGDPADDVTCMAINYVFFALQSPESWQRGFLPLWERFWETYLEGSRDGELLSVAPPFFAWRGLVLANPAWYPAVSDEARDAILTLVERYLDDGRLEPARAAELFR